ncbi:hypothetical protein TNCV_4969371 [Trichonephila clavipes]|nr:hypothetical protein TNCV_4969371 [Trichonephila clavipes]
MFEISPQMSLRGHNLEIDAPEKTSFIPLSDKDRRREPPIHNPSQEGWWTRKTLTDLPKVLQQMVAGVLSEVGIGLVHNGSHESNRSSLPGLSLFLLAMGTFGPFSEQIDDFGIM